MSPFILYSDGEGNIFEDNTLYACGRSGWDALPVDESDWILLPQGGSLYELPGRRGIGIDVETGDMRLCEKGWAVAAFIPPAHTGLYLSAYETSHNAPTLPLFCYTAAGWFDEKFYVPAVRIEQDIRQEAKGYHEAEIKSGAENLLQALSKQSPGKTPDGELLQHLSLSRRPEFITRTMGMSGTGFSGLQCKLHRLHFISTAGRNHTFNPGPSYVSSEG
ncbi:MAG: hypothetical protein WDM78_03790 [Puia sp.]